MKTAKNKRYKFCRFTTAMISTLISDKFCYRFTGTMVSTLLSDKFVTTALVDYDQWIMISTLLSDKFAIAALVQ